jgi:hypothetical protein
MIVPPSMTALIDWVTVLDEIAWLLGDPVEGAPMRNRVSTVALATYLRVPRSTLRNWQDGSEPKHSDGEALLLVWCRLSSKAAEFAPRTRRTFSAADLKRRETV